MNHYVEITFAKHLNPSAFAVKVIAHIHGVKVRHKLEDLALDFPCWKEPRSFMRAQLGHVIRLFGSRETLTFFLKKSHLTVDLLAEGIAVQGIQPVPDAITGYAALRRNHRVGKIEKLLKQPDSIRFDKTCRAITQNTHEIANRIGRPVEQIAAMEQLHHQLHVEIKNCVELKIPSQSTSKVFTLCLERQPCQTIAEMPLFSSYGLCLENGYLPVW